MLNESICQSDNIPLCLGSKIWPSYPEGGIFIGIILLIIIGLLYLRYILENRKI